MLGRPQDQSAPTAADVEEAFAGLQIEFAADVFEFLLLGEIERIIRSPEIGAGVDPIPVEPETVELVAHVVVMLDRLAVGGTGVPPPLPDVGALAIDFGIAGHQLLADAHRLANVAVEIEIALHVAPGDLAQTGIDQRHSACGERTVRRSSGLSPDWMVLPFQSVRLNGRWSRLSDPQACRSWALPAWHSSKR